MVSRFHYAAVSDAGKVVTSPGGLRPDGWRMPGTVAEDDPEYLHSGTGCCYQNEGGYQFHTSMVR